MIDYVTSTMTEDEMNAAYKANFQEALEKAGDDAWALAFRATRVALSEDFRRAWENWFDGRTYAIRAEERSVRTAMRREHFEKQFGVSDKAPPRRAVAPAQPAEPARGSDSTAAAREPASSRTAAAQPQPSPSPSPSRAPSSPPAGSTVPAGQKNSDSADDAEAVNRALRALFGTTMEDSQ